MNRQPTARSSAASHLNNKRSNRNSAKGNLPEKDCALTHVIAQRPSAKVMAMAKSTGGVIIQQLYPPG